MLDFDKPFFGCLVDAAGNFLCFLRWGTTGELCPYRFLSLQMWDEEERPIPQPYPTPTDYLALYETEPLTGEWIVDLQNLPVGFSVVAFAVDPARWEAEWGAIVTDFARKQWSLTEQRVVLRPGHEQKSNGRVVPLGDASVELSHTVRCGEPAYRLRGERPAIETEKDFPGLLFTQVDRFRRDPVTPFERLGAAVATASLLAAALTVTPQEEESGTVAGVSADTAALSVTRAKEGR